MSLSVQGGDDAENRLDASTVIADRTARRLLIVGDPGSGKSTLLKAYGVGSIRHRHGLEIGELRTIAKVNEFEVRDKYPNHSGTTGALPHHQHKHQTTHKIN